MSNLKPSEAKKRINSLAKEAEPFLFYINFEMDDIYVYPMDSIPRHIRYQINGKQNFSSLRQTILPASIVFESIPISKKVYEKAFMQVKEEINYGNSFLLNLSFPSRLNINLSFDQIFDHSRAKYKLQIGEEFIVYSPETFVKISNGVISSNPMKGTIDAKLPYAKKLLLDNEKELAEHYTIVDLIRNDLSKVAKNVVVSKFRYIDEISSASGKLLQVSSKIEGKLAENYLDTLGDLIFELLPAGSISGAPKKKTIEIIQAAEGIKRGFYTGVMGIFDGQDLDTGVMIRCIEKRDGTNYYRSGGGITFMSNLEEEYQELIDKIYVPIIRSNTNTGRKDTLTSIS